jgi:Chaperone of endosialidase
VSNSCYIGQIFGAAAFRGSAVLINSDGKLGTQVSNTALGAQAGGGVTTANNVICIGTSGANANNSCYIGNIFGQSIDPATAVFALIDSNGKLGTVLSSRPFKQDIEPMDKASEAILSLKPVTFHYKSDPKSIPHYGLVAEEVAGVDPSLAVRDKNGEIMSVHYDRCGT